MIIGSEGVGGNGQTDFDLSRIPREMRELKQWVVWRYQQRKNEPKPTKVPFRADSPRVNAKSTDPDTWATIDAAVAAYLEPSNNVDGIGFVFAEGGPYVGIDFDNCLDPDGAILPWAKAWLDQLVGYAEVSPSGQGVKVFARGEVPGGKGRKRDGLGPGQRGAVEVYVRGRFFTVTSRCLDDAHSKIGDGGAILAGLRAEWFPPQARAPRARKPPALRKSDQEVIAHIQESRQARKFVDLFHHGKTDDYASDDSRADLALCSILAWWTGGDVAAIDRLFRQSALFRDEKWERDSYREPTLDVACTQSSFYDPKHWDPDRRRPRIAPPIDPDAMVDTPGGGGPGEPPPPGDPGGDPREGDEDPHRLARQFLASCYGHRDGSRLRFWNEEWLGWTGQAWIALPDKEVAAEVTGSIKREFDRIAVARGRSTRPVTTTVVSNAMNALRNLAVLSRRDCPGQPAWLGPFEPGEDLPDVRDVLPAANALVDLTTVRDGGAATMAPTPRLFSPNTLGYAFDARAAAPRRWLDFLGQLWPDDPQSIETLQEWFGYLLTPDTSQQKILMVIGPKRSGKGTIGRVLRALVGVDNVAAPKLSSLSTPFGLQPLIGKTLAIIGDARLSGRADSQVIVEHLLSVSGEDAQTIDRKHLSSWTGHLPTRFVLFSNLLPRLGDESGAFPGRLVFLQLTKTFYNGEDTKLTERLLAERSGILLWAIEGWARLRERGRFVQPSSADDLKVEMDELASPVATFLAEECEAAPGTTTEVADVFAAWKRWCHDNGRDHVGDTALLGRNLRAALPQLKTGQKREDGSRLRVFQGLALKRPAPTFASP